jgi:methionyl-tRNA formyltransferase
MKRNLRIVYMGTPEFAVEPLRAIIDAGYDVAAVVTAPDKPAGRGQKLHASPVKDYALQHNLPVLQPVSLKNPEFVNELKNFNANLQVVVAFRMLPEIVWQMPEHGTLNLHASLLPQYRGAAPINHAIINGETETGLTTFFIEKEIDTGNIILSKRIPILPADDAGTLHDRMMSEGAILVLETLQMISTGNVNTLSQESLQPEQSILKPAPKIFKQDCKINWNAPCLQILNLVRGLSPFPGAFSTLISEDGAQKKLKIFKTSFEISDIRLTPGTIITDGKKLLSVAAGDGIIFIEELQLEGKKRMVTAEFLRGVQITGGFRFE